MPRQRSARRIISRSAAISAPSSSKAFRAWVLPTRNEAKRFNIFIDTLYEARGNLICSAEAPPHELYTEGDGAFEFERTVSRLIEMQSEDYIRRQT